MASKQAIWILGTFCILLENCAVLGVLAQNNTDCELLNVAVGFNQKDHDKNKKGHENDNKLQKLKELDGLYNMVNVNLTDTGHHKADGTYYQRKNRTTFSHHGDSDQIVCLLYNISDSGHLFYFKNNNDGHCNATDKTMNDEQMILRKQKNSNIVVLNNQHCENKGCVSFVNITCPDGDTQSSQPVGTWGWLSEPIQRTIIALVVIVPLMIILIPAAYTKREKIRVVVRNRIQATMAWMSTTKDGDTVVNYTTVTVDETTGATTTHSSQKQVADSDTDAVLELDVMTGDVAVATDVTTSDHDATHTEPIVSVVKKDDTSSKKGKSRFVIKARCQKGRAEGDRSSGVYETIPDDLLGGPVYEEAPDEKPDTSVEYDADMTTVVDNALYRQALKRGGDHDDDVTIIQDNVNYDTSACLSPRDNDDVTIIHDNVNYDTSACLSPRDNDDVTVIQDNPNYETSAPLKPLVNGDEDVTVVQDNPNYETSASFKVSR